MCQTQANHHQLDKQQKIYLPRCYQGNGIMYPNGDFGQPTLNELMNQALSFLECKGNFNRKFQKKFGLALAVLHICVMVSSANGRF